MQTKQLKKVDLRKNNNSLNFWFLSDAVNKFKFEKHLEAVNMKHLKKLVKFFICDTKCSRMQENEDHELISTFAEAYWFEMS